MTPQNINPLYAALASVPDFDLYLETNSITDIIDHIKLYAADQRGSAFSSLGVHRRSLP